MPTLNLKPAHKAVKAYFDELKAVAHLDFYDEGAVSPAFAELLRHCGRQTRLTLVEQFPLAQGGRNLRVDGALVDELQNSPRLLGGQGHQRRLGKRDSEEI